MSLALSRYTGKYTYHQLETRHPQFPIFVNDANFRYTKLLTFVINIYTGIFDFG
ncbi:unnamed protein product [Brassica rapa]|uniref:Uncharacterized protein n=1 Tax=Brassica campestris TaxID=3711 RepID=A0A8D9D0J0_BRACM|nr:unnamed protein product [Brassica rapa]